MTNRSPFEPFVDDATCEFAETDAFVVGVTIECSQSLRRDSDAEVGGFVFLELGWRGHFYSLWPYVCVEHHVLDTQRNCSENGWISRNAYRADVGRNILLPTSKKATKTMARRKLKIQGKRVKKVRKAGNYKRNYLTQVIARLDFAAEHKLLEGGPSPAVVKVLKANFPIIEQKKQVQFQAVQLLGAKTPLELKDGLQQSVVESYQWFFHNKDRTKTFHIAHDCCYVEYKKYSQFADLRKDFLDVLQALFESIPTLQASRVGLRYVDTIVMHEENPTDWSQYLKPHLLGIFKLATDPATIARALHVLDFDYGETRMRFQYGMPNPDFPTPIRQKQFLLDYDAFCTGLFTLNDVERYLDQFHDKIKASFEEVITDNLREKMNNNE